MVGPNCMGVLNSSESVSMNGTFSPVLPPYGDIAFASQSGAMGMTILDYASEVGIGISQFVSLGNKADVGGNDLIASRVSVRHAGLRAWLGRRHGRENPSWLLRLDGRPPVPGQQPVTRAHSRRSIWLPTHCSVSAGSSEPIRSSNYLMQPSLSAGPRFRKEIESPF